MRPPRPPHPFPSKPCQIDDITVTNSQSTLTSVDSDSIVANGAPEATANTTAQTQCCDLTKLCSPLTSISAQTDQWDRPFAVKNTETPSHVQLEHPRPRPRSKFSVQPVSSEVKVQTLVKLREDGVATLAARAERDTANQGVSQGKYLQELLEAFSADDWGFPDQRSDSSNSQSESEEGDEVDKEDNQEDMGTLKARIQAFEQQPVADGSCGDSNNKDFVAAKRPEPRPRPRLQGQPAKSVPPTVAPKPKNFSHAPKPSTKLFWEGDGLSAVAGVSCSSQALELTETSQPDTEPAPAFAPNTSSALEPPLCKNTEKPPLTPKPATETLTPGTSVPVPAPRPPPPKLTPSVSETPSLANPKPPPRPAIAPRASTGTSNQEKSIVAGLATPALPPRPNSEAQTETQNQKKEDTADLTGEFCSDGAFSSP